jgi:hypothetical protein
MKHWREEWDSHADDEAARYDKMAVADVIADIRRGRFGNYHTIWPAVARRATLAEVGWELLDVLESDAPYLARYHCAAALLQLLQSAEFEPIALSAKGFPLARNLNDVRARIEARIGPRSRA